MSDDDPQERDIGPADRDDALFVNLILIFQGAAMQQMGKILNPLSGKIERNIEQARFSIDTLAMLKEKTRGNLSADLERLLDSTLLNLRMNFVEESAKPDQAGEGGETAGRRGEQPAEEPGPEARHEDGPPHETGEGRGAKPDGGGRPAGKAGGRRPGPRQDKS
jgi:hypothetical protein